MVKEHGWSVCLDFDRMIDDYIKSRTNDYILILKIRNYESQIVKYAAQI